MAGYSRLDPFNRGDKYLCCDQLEMKFSEGERLNATIVANFHLHAEKSFVYVNGVYNSEMDAVSTAKQISRMVGCGVFLF